MLGSGVVDYLRQKLLDNSESDLILHIARPQGSEKSHRSPEPHRAFLLKGVSHGRCPISRQSHSPRPHALCLFSPTTGRKLDVTDRPFLKQICNNPPPPKKRSQEIFVNKMGKRGLGTGSKVYCPQSCYAKRCTCGRMCRTSRKSCPEGRTHLQGAGCWTDWDPIFFFYSGGKEVANHLGAHCDRYPG